MASGARKFVLQQLDRARERLAVELPDLPTGVVTATSPFTVLFMGASLSSPHVRRLVSYTPAVNDQTTMVRSGGLWVAIGPTV